MEILGKLFGSEARVKIIRLFLFNPKQAFSANDVIDRAKVKSTLARKELSQLKKAKLIQDKVFVSIVEKKKGKKTVNVKKREKGFILSDKFPYLKQLQNLLIYTVLIKNEEIIRKINVAGKIKLVIISGVFLQDFDRRIDILVVGDGVHANIFESVIKTLESEIGKELRYTFLTSVDFNYRLGMYDKLIRDILDYPHKIIADKIGFAESRPRTPLS